jgi:hypothetical protein
MISTAASALRVGYAAMRVRRFDPIAAFLLAADGVTVDIAKGLLGLLALGTDAIVLAIVLGGIGYFLRRFRTPLRQSRSAPQPAGEHP